MLHALALACRVVGSVTFQQVDDTPRTEAAADSHNQNLQSVNSRSEKFHIHFLHLIKRLNCVTKKPPFQAAGTSGQLGPKSIYQLNEIVCAVQIVIIENVSVLVRGVHLIHRVFFLGL